jgi:hypothetical protein
MKVVLMHLCASPGLGAGSENVEGEVELPWEPVGHGAIAIGNVTMCKEFWRTFVRSLGVMNWIKEGYRLLLTVSPPPRREFANASLALEHRKFISNAVAEMLAVDVMTLLPQGRNHGWLAPGGWSLKLEPGCAGSR